MSVYDEIRARIKADKERAALWPNDESFEDARAEIVGDILKIAERWQHKAQEYGPEESFVAFRAMVCDQVLDAINEGLWD